MVDCKSVSLVFFPDGVVGNFGAALLAGTIERNPIGQDFEDHIRKHLPILRSHGLHEAADYLEQWILGTLIEEPLLDVSALLGCFPTPVGC